MTENRLKPGDVAPSVRVYDVQGQAVMSDDLWADGPVVLTFLRHFGCIFCREWLAELEKAHEKIAAAGLRILAIGLGEPKHATHFCGKLAPNLTCHVDLDKQAYQEYGLKQASVLSMANVKALAAGARAAAAGHMQGKPTGDQRMLPGTFIINEKGVVQFAYYSSHAGDHPAIETLLAVHP